MIKPSEIRRLFGERLQAMPGVPPIAWEDQDIDPPRPFLAFRHVPVTLTDDTIGGGFAVASGFVEITVVTRVGGLGVVSDDLVARVMDWFPCTLRLIGLEPALGTDGDDFVLVIDSEDGPLPFYKLTRRASNVVITQPPVPLPGFRDGPDWRASVRINYRSEMVSSRVIQAQ